MRLWTGPDRGDFAAALRAFLASYEANPVPDVLYNIGMCHKALGDFPAANVFGDYVAAVGGGMTVEERAEFDGLLEELVPQIGRLTVQGAESGASLSVDGAPAGTTSMSGWFAVTPGRHTVNVTHDGFQPLSTQVDVPAGQALPVNVRLVAVAPVPDSHPPVAVWPLIPATGEPAGESAGLGPWFWTSAAVAGAAAFGMAITGGLTLKYWDDYEAGGFTDPDLRDTTLALRTTTDVLLGVALAGAVVATVLLLLPDDEKSAPPGGSVGAALLPGALAVWW